MTTDTNGALAAYPADIWIVLLGVHASLGSKILQGERSLTVDPIRKRAARFQVSPRLFLDGGE